MIKQEQPDPESSCEIVKPSLPTSEIKQEIVDLYDSDDAIPDLDDIPDIPDLDGPDWDERLPKIGETFHQPHEIKQEIEDIPDIPTGKNQKVVTKSEFEISVKPNRFWMLLLTQFN